MVKHGKEYKRCPLILFYQFSRLYTVTFVFVVISCIWDALCDVLILLHLR